MTTVGDPDEIPEIEVAPLEDPVPREVPLIIPTEPPLPLPEQPERAPELVPV